MATDTPPEPWRSFLADIDAAAPEDLALHCCIGGFAVSLYYGLSRPTGDLEAIEVAQSGRRASACDAERRFYRLIRDARQHGNGSPH